MANRVTSKDGKSEKEKIFKHMLVCIQTDLGNLQVSRNTNEASKSKTILNVIKMCEDFSKGEESCKVKLDFFIETIEEIKNDYSIQYHKYKLHRLGHVFIKSLLNDLLKDWTPIKSNIEYGIPEFQRLKTILVSADLDQNTANDRCTYNDIISDVVIPKFINHIENWDPHFPFCLLDLLQKWKEVIPKNSFSMLMQSVEVRLEFLVSNWKISEKHVSFHPFIAPWVPHLEEYSSSLFLVIKETLIGFLFGCEVTEPFALDLIQTWAQVLPSKVLDNILDRSIITALQIIVDDVKITPSVESFQSVKCIFLWKKFLPNRKLIKILDSLFFEKWISFLNDWLKSSPNSLEIKSWYIDSKSIFPIDFHDDKVIKTNFSKAVSLIMNHFGHKPSYTNAKTFKNFHNSNKFSSTNFENNFQTKKSNKQKFKYSLEELVEKKASLLGLLFDTKSFMKYQIYTIGIKTIKVEDGVVFSKTKGNYIPVSVLSIFN